MKIWVDDIRTPPGDEEWVWCKTSEIAIEWLDSSRIRTQSNWDDEVRKAWTIELMSLDHDLGGDDTSRAVVLWCCINQWWPEEVVVHSANPVGIEYLEGMVKRYHPNGEDYNPDRI